MEKIDRIVLNVAFFAVLLMLGVWLTKMVIQPPPMEIVDLPEPVVQANPSVQAEGVVSNDDGSVIVH